MGFQLNTQGFMRQLHQIEERQMHDIEIGCRTAGGIVAAQAKHDAPWRDHSHDARSGIHYTVERHGSIFTITLSGSVHYLVYLELAHGKRWAVLWPVMQKNKERMLQIIAKTASLKLK